MFQTQIRLGRLAIAAGLVSIVLSVACLTNRPTAAARAVSAFRIENATASPVQITVEVLDADGNILDVGGTFGAVSIPVVTVTPGSVTFSTLEPVGAAAAAQGTTAVDGGIDGGTGAGAPLTIGSQATVRVPGFTMSEGFLVCGEAIRITGQIETSEALILFDGDGTGTFGFDEGSVGESGERFLVRIVHFDCGDSVVIRVDDDGVGVGGDSGQTANGTLAVVGAGELSPFDAIVDPGEGADGSGDGDAPVVSTDITIQIANAGSVIATSVVRVNNGVDEQDFTVTVPPGAQTEGLFDCGTQYTISATYPNPETPEDQETTALVILTGDGTGSPAFDEVSVSRQGERILVVGTHVNCGDTILVTLDDEAEPIGFQGIGVLSGTVEVIPGE